MANFYGLPVMISMFLAFKCLLIEPVLSTTSDIAPEIAVADLKSPPLDFSIKREPVHYDSSPPPPPKYYEYLENCTRQIPQECGNNILVGLINGTHVTSHCCLKLVDMGRDCHFALVNELSKLKVDKKDPDYEKKEHFLSSLSHTGPAVWDYCVKIVKKIG